MTKEELANSIENLHHNKNSDRPGAESNLCEVSFRADTKSG